MKEKLKSIMLKQSNKWFTKNVEDYHLRGTFNKELYKQYLLEREAI